MGRIYEIKGYVLEFYAKYSKYIDMGAKFILALLTFAIISNCIGYFEVIANPAVTVGLSLVCMFLPTALTVVFAAVIIVIQLFMLAPGVAMIAGLLFLAMFALYFRFSPENPMIILLTPIAFVLKIPVFVPVVYGLIGSPVCAVPIAFGTIIYYMITHVNSYSTMIETAAESGSSAQMMTFVQQLFSNKEMWLTIVSFTVCLILVYSIKNLAVDHAREIAVAAGILVNIILMTFGQVMLDIPVSYTALIIGSIVVAVVIIVMEIFLFSADYTRAEHLQFEDDEYYYYVKAVPKVSVAVPEKTVKKYNIHQKQELTESDTPRDESGMSEEEIEEERRIRMEQEESEIQKIIEEELKH